MSWTRRRRRSRLMRKRLRAEQLGRREALLHDEREQRRPPAGPRSPTGLRVRRRRRDGCAGSRRQPGRRPTTAGSGGCRRAVPPDPRTTRHGDPVAFDGVALEPARDQSGRAVEVCARPALEHRRPLVTEVGDHAVVQAHRLVAHELPPLRSHLAPDLPAGDRRGRRAGPRQDAALACACSRAATSRASSYAVCSGIATRMRATARGVAPRGRRYLWTTLAVRRPVDGCRPARRPGRHTDGASGCPVRMTSAGAGAVRR